MKVRHVKQGIMIGVGAFLIAVGVNMFLAPHEIAAGGASGVGILVEAVFGWDRALVVLVMNVILLIGCYFLLGKRTTVKIMIGCVLFPLALEIVPRVMVTEDRMLSVIYGSIFFGLGASTLYQVNSSSGGTTIPPLVLQKYFNVNPSIGLLFSDSVVVLFNLFVFGIDSLLLAFLSLIITSILMRGMEKRRAERIFVSISSELAIERILEDITDLSQNRRNIKPVHYSPIANQNEIVIRTEKKEYNRLAKQIKTLDKEAKIIIL